MHMKNKLVFLAIAFNAIVFAQPNSAELDSSMVFVKGGSFQMGSTVGKADERPVHNVKLNDFYIGKYEVTQALWRQVMQGDEGSKSDCSTCPVYDITWESIQTFLSKLNQLTGKHYRLPTEAEWEYAAAGGSKSKGFKYSGSNTLNDVAWYEDNAGMKTHPAGQKQPNEIGIYDMSGNVWEICSDWYEKSFYKNSTQGNPEDMRPGKYHVSRGGSWRSPEQRCQVHARNSDIHDHHIGNGGFRLVMEF